MTELERREFHVVKNKETGKYELKIKAGAEAKFHGEHTVGFNRLSTAIASDKTVTVNVSNTYTEANGHAHDVAHEFGGGVTINQPNGTQRSTSLPKAIRSN